MAEKKETKRAAETIRFRTEENDDAARSARRFAALVVVQGAEVDLGTLVVCDRPVNLGRDPDVELPLRDGSISRRHCRVEREDDGGYVLMDLGSTNGTRLNGAKIKERQRLADGDKIFLGASVVKFAFADSLDMEYQVRLEWMAKTDALTGLLSKRQFDAAFASAVEAARATGLSLAVLVMDLDGLKQINDTYGHGMGGHTIAQASQLLREILGGVGQTCRFGGDEFISFLPAHDRGAGCSVAEAVRDGIATHTFEKDGVRVSLTISIGVALFPDDGDSPDELFAAADQALYRAKAAGKNQVVSR
ncbi:MAG TPA: GGDEF domain-containing protein [Haliangiales bacterium]|nr:GGDEF domain-containing protein [Haliangiales bacterium]